MKDFIIEFNDGEQYALRRETPNGYIIDKRFMGKNTARNVFLSYEQLCHMLIEEGTNDNIVCLCAVPKGEWNV